MKKNIFALIALVGFTSFSFAQSPEMPVPPMPEAPVADTPVADATAADTTASRAKAACTPADLQRMSLGLRSGLTIPYGGTEQYTHSIGGEVALDLQYAMYWRKNTNRLGLLFGLSMGYQKTGMNVTDFSKAYTTSTDGGNIDYSLKALDIKETKKQWNMEIPLMFALLADNGVFFNVGPRFAFPVWHRSMVTMPKTADINAFFSKEGVNVPNELVTGKAAASAETQWNAPVMTLKLGAELGYEFRFANQDALDLGLYVDWAAVSAYRNKECTDFIQILAPSSENVPAQVIFNSPSDAIANKLGAVNVGLKLSYNFYLEKKAKPAAPESQE